MAHSWATFRKAACSGLEELGIVLDDELNNAAQGDETKISHESSRTEIWVVPTNEELIVARQTQDLLQGE